MMELYGKKTGNDEMRETQEFVRRADAFFDCLNVRGLDTGYRKRKPNCLPYKSTDDPRFKVSIIHVQYTYIYLLTMAYN